MYNKNRALAAYTFSHFSVDFACFFVLCRAFVPAAGDAQTAAAGLLLYNIIAFGLQPVIGYICDGRAKLPAGAVGCSLTLLGAAVSFAPWPALVICALGNAFFHVGGGIDSLKSAGGGAARSGIFVSSGAVGVSLGILLGKTAGAPPLLPMALLALSTASIVVFANGEAPAEPMRFRFAAKLGPAALIALSCAVIIVRALAGGLISTPWKTAGLVGLLPGFAACAGKAAGGILGDRLGHRRVCIASLAASVPLLCLCQGSAALSCLGIALFNMTMPITLCALAHALPKNPGLAFGLSTLALLCGSMPLFFFAAPDSPALLAALAVLSAILIYITTRNERKVSDEKTQQQAV